MAERALSGLTVVEYSEGVAGALCAKAMADFGADVIKVEPRTGDDSRRRGPFVNDVPDTEASGQFLYLNANKRGITLDLAAERGHSTMARLLEIADVFVGDLPFLRARELGLNYERVQTTNPNLVATYISAFGHSGPYRDYHGADLIAWHMGGMGNETPFYGVTDLENQPPLRGPAHQADYLAGWTAAAASMAALAYRNAYGVGQMVDISAMVAVANHIRNNFGTYSYDISALPDSRLTTMFPWVWPCKDGYISTSFALDHWWKALKDIMGNPGWAENPEFDDLNGKRRNVEFIESHLKEWFALYTRRELYEMMQSRGIPCFPVQSIDEILKAPQYESRNFFVTQNHPEAGEIKQLGPPIRMWGTPWSLYRPAPLLGQHNEAIRNELHRVVLGNAAPKPVASTLQENRNRPLEGLRVLDFGWILSVPHCGTWLGTLGAEVIRVESQARLELSRSGVFAAADGIAGLNRSSSWNTLNMCKQDITLNLGTIEAKKLVKELVSISDVVTENFATGVFDRLGLGYESLRKVKPDIIMLSGSTLGVTGPEKEASGWGPNVASYAGQPFLSGYKDGPPVNLGGNWPDFLVGTMMAFGILSALRHRNKTGRGQYIEVSMAEVVSSMIPEAFLDYTMNRRLAERDGNHDRCMAPHNVYPCEGFDQWVAIAVQSDSQWMAICNTMGRPELSADNRFESLEARKCDENALDEIVSDWTRQHTPWEVTKMLQKAGIASGPVMNVIDLMNDPHMNARGYITEIDHAEVGPRMMPGIPVIFGAMPELAYSPAPLLGQYNDRVFGELLGMDSAKIKNLVLDKAIY